MIEEYQLIPYQLSALPAGPWLVFAPHADDETFGMGGTLLRAKQEGITVHIVVITDGALGGTKDDLIKIRQTEVKNVCNFLGIASLQCWSEPDRGLRVGREQITRVKATIAELNPATVFFPAPLEPHPDHRSTTRLIWQALAELYGSATSPAAVAYEISVQNPINALIDISGVMDQKWQAMQFYNSQNSENEYPELVRALNKTRTFSLPPTVKYAEGFYRYKPQDLTRPLEQIHHETYCLYWQ